MGLIVAPADRWAGRALARKDIRCRKIRRRRSLRHNEGRRCLFA